MDQEALPVVVECKDCRHHAEAYAQLLCCRFATAVPCTSARDYRSECGPEGRLFVPLKQVKK